jgi:hypothetical protein
MRADEVFGLEFHAKCVDSSERVHGLIEGVINHPYSRDLVVEYPTHAIELRLSCVAPRILG